MDTIHKAYIKMFESVDNSTYFTTPTNIEPTQEVPTFIRKHMIASRILDSFTGYTSSTTHHDEYKQLAKSIYHNFPHSMVMHNYQGQGRNPKGPTSIHVPVLMSNIATRSDVLFPYDSIDNALYKCNIAKDDLSLTNKPFPHIMDEEDKHHFGQIFKSDATIDSVSNAINHFRNKYRGVLPGYHDNSFDMKYAHKHSYGDTLNQSYMNKISNKNISKSEVKDIIDRPVNHPHALIHNLLGLDPAIAQTAIDAAKYPLGSDRPIYRLHGISRDMPNISHNDLMKSWYFNSSGDAKPIISHVAAMIDGHNISRPTRAGFHFSHEDIHPDEKAAIESMKKETEEFYNKKYASKIKKGVDVKIKLYRGVRIPPGTNTYVPDGAESWTSSKSEAGKWIKRYSTPETKSHLHVLETEVSPNDILWSHESHAGKIPPEDDIVVQKEHVVLGKRLKAIKVTPL